VAKHLEDGSNGERLAIDHLRNLGYQILHQNWRYRHLEVDAIAKDGDTLVFVEVKSRRSKAFGLPHEFVDWQKQKNLIQAAEAFLAKSTHLGEIRFDIVSVFLTTREIEVIKDAFWSN
jgi:putative endonuclease